MKLTIKDLKQQKFVMEAEPTTTIAELKAKIQEEKQWPTTEQKLIYSGKILKDDDTVASYNIEEKGFIVCMISKPKPAPGAAAASATAARAPSTPAASNVTRTPAAPAAPVSSTTATNAPATPTPAPQSQANVSPSARRLDDPSSLALGNERTEAIASMEAMGFPRDQIDRAMRAAFFNPDRAVEYLLSGIPEHLQRDDRPAAPPAAAAARSPAPPATQQPTADTAAPAASIEPEIANLLPGGGEGGGEEPFNMFEAAAAQGRTGARGAGATAGAGGAGAAAGALEFLRNNPQFQQLRHLVQQQPQMLEPIMQQLAQGNPQLAAMIRSSPEEFLELLAEDNDDDTALPPGAQVVSISEEERDAIERLCRLGFERDLVIQAYFACDKNEELAANFLFDQPDEDEQ